jgi:hypothetical protein
VPQARGQHVRLPGRCRQRGAREALQREQHLVGAGLGPVEGLVRRGEEPRVPRRGDRLQLGPGARQRARPEPPEHLGVDELGLGPTGGETSGHQPSRGRLPFQDEADGGHAQAEGRGHIGGRERPVGAGEPRHQLCERVAALRREGARVAGRDGDAEGVAEKSEVGGGDEVRASCQLDDGGPRAQGGDRVVEVEAVDPL